MRAPLAPHPAGNFAVPAYAISSLMPGLETFDALDPAGTMTPIFLNDDWVYSATFVGNDFTKLYAIVNDSWETPAEATARSIPRPARSR